MKHAILISFAAATLALAAAIPVYAGSFGSGDMGGSMHNPPHGDPGGPGGWGDGDWHNRGVPGPEVGTGIPALLAAGGFMWLVRRRQRKAQADG